MSTPKLVAMTKWGGGVRRGGRTDNRCEFGCCLLRRWLVRSHSLVLEYLDMN